MSSPLSVEKNIDLKELCVFTKNLIYDYTAIFSIFHSSHLFYSVIVYSRINPTSSFNDTVGTKPVTRMKKARYCKKQRVMISVTFD